MPKAEKLQPELKELCDAFHNEVGADREVKIIDVAKAKQRGVNEALYKLRELTTNKCVTLRQVGPVALRPDVHVPVNNPSPDRLRDAAILANKPFKETLKLIIKKAKLPDNRLTIGPVKSLEGIRRKLEEKREVSNVEQKEEEKQLSEPPVKIFDLNRATIVFESDAELKILLEGIDEYFGGIACCKNVFYLQQSWSVHSEETLQPPRLHLNLFLKTQGGYPYSSELLRLLEPGVPWVIELQLTTQAILDVKDPSHRFYELLRLEGRPLPRYCPVCEFVQTLVPNKAVIPKRAVSRSIKAVMEATWVVDPNTTVAVAYNIINGMEATKMDEAKFLSRLDHPNVVAILGVLVGKDGFLTEWIDGGSLHDHLRGNQDQKQVNEELRWDIALQICEALIYLHQNGVVHFDLKSANVLVSFDPLRVKLCDFGLSKSQKSTFSGGGAVGGTHNWQAPETFTQVDRFQPSADMWSFGCVLIELFTKEHITPWNGLSREQIEQEHKGEQPPELLTIVHQRVYEITKRCLSLEPKRRPSAVEVKNLLLDARNIPPDEGNHVRVRTSALQEAITRQPGFLFPSEMSAFLEGRQEEKQLLEHKTEEREEKEKNHMKTLVSKLRKKVSELKRDPYLVNQFVLPPVSAAQPEVKDAGCFTNCCWRFHSTKRQRGHETWWERFAERLWGFVVFYPCLVRINKMFYQHHIEFGLLFKIFCGACFAMLPFSLLWDFVLYYLPDDPYDQICGETSHVMSSSEAVHPFLLYCIIALAYSYSHAEVSSFPRSPAFPVRWELENLERVVTVLGTNRHQWAHETKRALPVIGATISSVALAIFWVLYLLPSHPSCALFRCGLCENSMAYSTLREMFLVSAGFLCIERWCSRVVSMLNVMSEVNFLLANRRREPERVCCFKRKKLDGNKFSFTGDMTTFRRFVDFHNEALAVLSRSAFRVRLGLLAHLIVFQFLWCYLRLEVTRSLCWVSNLIALSLILCLCLAMTFNKKLEQHEKLLKNEKKNLEVVERSLSQIRAHGQEIYTLINSEPPLQFSNATIVLFDALCLASDQLALCALGRSQCVCSIFETCSQLLRFAQPTETKPPDKEVILTCLEVLDKTEKTVFPEIAEIKQMKEQLVIEPKLDLFCFPANAQRLKRIPRPWMIRAVFLGPILMSVASLQKCFVFCCD